LEFLFLVFNFYNKFYLHNYLINFLLRFYFPTNCENFSPNFFPLLGGNQDPLADDPGKGELC
jgi:hypothetical protein